MSSAQKLWAVADSLLSLFVFFPLSVFYWRGTWGLQDVYIYPQDVYISNTISVICGFMGCTIMQFTQPYLFQHIPLQNTKTYFVLSRLYLYSNGWFVMGYWRGVWNLVDYYFTYGWINSLILYAICQMINALTKTMQSNIGLPFAVFMDTDVDVLHPDMLLSNQKSSVLVKRVDVVFCQLVIVTCNVIVWRGLWNISDAFLFPQQPLLSNIISITAGYVLCIFLLLVKAPAAKISQKLESYHVVCKNIFEAVVLLFTTQVVLLMWRGGWYLCERYIIPDPIVGNWISHWLGTVLLCVFQIFNSVTINGVEKDWEWESGEVMFPMSYLNNMLNNFKLTCMSKDKCKDSHIDSLMATGIDCCDKNCTTTEQVVESNSTHSFTTDISKPELKVSISL